MFKTLRDATIYRTHLETEMTAAGLGAVEVEKLESMEGLWYTKRYTSKEVWKPDKEGTGLKEVDLGRVEWLRGIHI